jgi:serine/threonine protein kinase
MFRTSAILFSERLRQRFTLIFNLEGFTIVAFAFTDIALHVDIGEEVHFDKQFEFGSSNPQIRETALKLFYDEARHLESLGKHHNIPELLAYFDIEGQPYLIQQFIDGQDLEQELSTGGVFVKVGSYSSDSAGFRVVCC